MISRTPATPIEPALHDRLVGSSEPAGDARGGHRLGPLVNIVWLEHAIYGRAYAVGFFLAAATIVFTAARLRPDTRHIGTHQQLGLPPCGFLTVTGLPCPTCGMTTAFVYTVHGHIFEGIRSQVAGFVLAIGTVAVGLIGAVAAVTGRRVSINWYRVNPLHCLWWGAAFIVAAWGIKMAVGLADGTLPGRY